MQECALLTACQFHMPDATSDERMYALVQLEHAVSQRVLHELPKVRQQAKENGTRRAMFFIQVERCCDWAVYHHGVRTCLAEHLLSLLGRLHILLKLSPTASDDGNSLASEMGCALSILQGLCLTNETSRQLCSSKSSLALFLAIVKAEYSQSNDSSCALGLLIPHTLDTLMCILVDAPTDVRRAFEHAHGLSIVRRVMNARPSPSAGAANMDTTGAKCIEFLLFYLQAKEFEQQASQQLSGSTAQSIFRPPETPKPKRGHARSRSAITATPFYTPLATPRSRQQRVLSYGSPTKHVAHGKLAMPPEANPFLHAQSRVRERESSDMLQTPRASTRHLDRETSPIRDPSRQEMTPTSVPMDRAPSSSVAPPFL